MLPVKSSCYDKYLTKTSRRNSKIIFTSKLDTQTAVSITWEPSLLYEPMYCPLFLPDTSQFKENLKLDPKSMLILSLIILSYTL